MEISKIPFEGHAEAYLHSYTTPWGKKVEEIVLGKAYDKPEDKPDYHEYDATTHKHLGTVIVSVTSVDPKLLGMKVDSSRI